MANGAQFNQFGQVVHYGSITELNGATGAAISPSSGYTGDGSLTPVAIAVDGIGNIWVLNNSGAPVCNLPGPPGTTGASSHCSTLTKLNGSTGQVISGLARYTSTSLYQTTAIAIDGAGNIWVTNTFLPGSLTEFVGAAAPVVTTSRRRGEPYHCDTSLATYLLLDSHVSLSPTDRIPKSPARYLPQLLTSTWT